MSDSMVMLLVLGILLGVLVLMGGIGGFIFWYHRRPAPEPTVTAGPQGPVAQIPTRQISIVRSSLSAIALGQYAVRGTLTVGPDGISYTRFLRGPKHHPHSDIAAVDGPDPARPTLLTIHLTSGWGIVALTGSPQGRHIALVELSRWHRIGPVPEPPVR